MNPALAKEAKNRLKFIQLNSKIITDDAITRLNSALEALHSNFTLKSHNPLDFAQKRSRQPPFPEAFPEKPEIADKPVSMKTRLSKAAVAFTTGGGKV